MRWLEILKSIGPMIIATTVPNGALIAPAIVQAIQEAESIKGATGQQKLAHVVNIATSAAQIAKASGVKIDPADVQHAASAAISATVDVVNIIDKAKTPTTPPSTP